MLNLVPGKHHAADWAQTYPNAFRIDLRAELQIPEKPKNSEHSKKKDNKAKVGHGFAPEGLTQYELLVHSIDREAEEPDQ